MNIILYNNHSENNKLNKTIVKIVKLQGYLRDQTSLVNPQIMIEFHPDQFDGYVKDDDQVYVVHNGIKIKWDTFINNYVLTANYVYIPDFNRYYFINDITSVRQNLWRLSLHVDVLMSYKKEISNTYAVVGRNQYVFNDYLLDERVSFSNKKEVYYYGINNTPDCKKFNSHINDDSMEVAKYNYVICTLGINDIVSTYINDTPSENTLPEVTTDTMGNSAFNNYRVCTAHQVSYFLNEVFDDDGKKSFVKSIIALPYEVDKILGESTATRAHINCGHDIVYLQIESEHLDGNYVPSHWALERVKFADFTFLEKPKSFKDLDPYTKYYLYCPYCDYIDIPAVYLGDRLQVFYIVNYDDGVSKVIVYDYTKQIVIESRQAQLGVRVAVSSSNQTELNNQKNALALNTTIGVLTSILSIVGGVATSNPLMVAGGGVAMGSTIGKAVTTSAQLIPMGKVEISSGQNGLYLPQDFHFRVEKTIPVNDDGYDGIYGKPLYEYKRLGDLSGMTIVSDEHLENFGSTTKSESDEIKSILNGGVIL